MMLTIRISSSRPRARMIEELDLEFKSLQSAIDGAREMVKNRSDSKVEVLTLDGALLFSCKANWEHRPAVIYPE